MLYETVGYLHCSICNKNIFSKSGLMNDQKIMFPYPWTTSLYSTVVLFIVIIKYFLRTTNIILLILFLWTVILKPNRKIKPLL